MNQSIQRIIRILVKPTLLAANIVTLLMISLPHLEAAQWHKEAIHQHSFWSDGNVFPEKASAQYRKLGHYFVATTNHTGIRSDRKIRLASPSSLELQTEQALTQPVGFEVDTESKKTATRDAKMPSGWTVGSGDWKMIDGTITVDASGEELVTVFFGDPEQQNYEISAKITFEKVDNDSRWASIIFRAGEEGTQPWSMVPIRFNTTAWNGMEFTIRNKGQWSVRRTNKAEEACKMGETRNLRLLVRGTTVEAYLEGQLLIRSAFCLDRDHGCVGLAASGCVVQFDEVTIKPLPDSKVTFAEMERQPCEVIAHRGYSGIAPENTLASIREAIKVGAGGCEFDVHSSKDGHIVVMHDRTVNRTTDGKGKVADLTLAELKKLDAGSWKGEKYTGEKVPTLSEVLVLLKDGGCVPVIEVKVEGISQKVVDAVRKADMVDKATVLSFSQNVVREIRRLEPKLACGWFCCKTLEGTPEEQVAWIANEAKKCNTNMVSPHFGMLSPKVIEGLKERGIQVWCWTANNPVEMDALMRWGVESIITDFPNEAIRLNKEIE